MRARDEKGTESARQTVIRAPEMAARRGVQIAGILLLGLQPMVVGCSDAWPDGLCSRSGVQPNLFLRELADSQIQALCQWEMALYSDQSRSEPSSCGVRWSPGWPTQEECERRLYAHRRQSPYVPPDSFRVCGEKPVGELPEPCNGPLASQPTTPPTCGEVGARPTIVAEYEGQAIARRDAYQRGDEYCPTFIYLNTLDDHVTVDVIPPRCDCDP